MAQNLTLSKTPMLQYIELFDLKYIDLGYNEYWRMAIQQDYSSWNALYSKEIEFRETKHMNMVFSVEGNQGSGKSAFLIANCQYISKKYGNKFLLDHLHFFHEDMQNDLKHFKKRTTYAQDEQPRIYGMMSSFIQAELANYEDIFRKPQVNIGYASPSLNVHSHFFIFQALDNIFLDEQGNPAAVEVMLKTMRKSDNMIMPRGLVRFKWVENKFWNAYNKKKDSFIKRMIGSKGNRTKILEEYAEKTFKAHGDKLIIQTTNGYRLKNKELLRFFIDKTIGAGNLTGQGMDMCVAILQERLIESAKRQ